MQEIESVTNVYQNASVMNVYGYEAADNIIS